MMLFFALSVLALGPLAVAQDLDGLVIPTDIEGYFAGLATNPTAVAGFEALVTQPAILSVLSAAQAAHSLDAGALQSALPAAISGISAPYRAVVSSVAGVIESFASTDGIVSLINAGAATAAAASSGATGLASVSTRSTLSSGASARTAGPSTMSTGSTNAGPSAASTMSTGSTNAGPSAASVTTGGAARPTGLPIGALAGVIAGAAFML